MTPASQLAVFSAATFFMLGLLLGVAKYVHIARRADAEAPTYISIAHRAALMYSFACLLIERFVHLSALEDVVELRAVLVQVVFFALAVVSYIIHGVLQDTDNQLRRPHVLGKGTVPPVLVIAFMVALILGEVGGFAVLVWGAL